MLKAVKRSLAMKPFCSVSLRRMSLYRVSCRHRYQRKNYNFNRNVIRIKNNKILLRFFCLKRTRKPPCLQNKILHECFGARPFLQHAISSNWHISNNNSKAYVCFTLKSSVLNLIYSVQTLVPLTFKLFNSATFCQLDILPNTVTPTLPVKI
jgi:hypothetical protein